MAKQTEGKGKRSGKLSNGVKAVGSAMRAALQKAGISRTLFARSGSEPKTSAAQSSERPTTKTKKKKQLRRDWQKKGRRGQVKSKKKRQLGGVDEYPSGVSPQALAVYGTKKKKPPNRPSSEATDTPSLIGVGPGSKVNPKLSTDTTAYEYVSPSVVATDRRMKPDKDEILELVVGLDFGTAFTKVVVQENERRVAWVVSFGEVADSQLLPTRVYLSGEKFSLASGEQAFSDLKTPLILGSLPVGHGVRVVAFLALVVRHTRAWVSREARDFIGGRSVQWHLRVGVPAKNLEDQKLVGAMQDMATAALALALVDRELITTASSERALAHSREFRNSSKTSMTLESGEVLYGDQIRLCPEQAAQVYGYVRSENWDRNAPKFMLVDVGGGTLDAAIFNVTLGDNGLRRFSFFRSIVVPLGTLMLHRRRTQWLLGHLGTDGDSVTVRDELLAVSAGPHYGETILNRMTEYLLECKFPDRTEDDKFGYDYSDQLWNQLIQPVRKRFDPNSRQWESLPLLFCGGGREIAIYRDFVASLNSDSSRHVNLHQFELEAPAGLRGSTQFHRVSVAYGLSFFEVDEFVTPDQIEEISSSVSGRADGRGFVSKDMV